MQVGRWQTQIQAAIKQTVWKGQRLLLTATGAAGCVLLLRLTGVLQSWEWSTQDQLLQLRPQEAVDERIIIISIDEPDLRKIGRWPVPDGILADLVQRIQAGKPRAIGLDIYRDLPVEPGHDRLQQAFRTTPNLVGIEKLRDGNSPGVAPPPILLQRDLVGFNNVVFDADQHIRRSLLYWTVEDQYKESFALKLALIYLQKAGISPQPARENPHFLQLGPAVFHPFLSNTGPYVWADAGGYQIFANFRGPSGLFRTVPLKAVLTGRVPATLFHDRIVLVGSTAVSLKDFAATPYSGGLTGPPNLTSGVEIQANFISQILSAALENRPLLRAWSEPLDWAWVWVWAWVGTTLSWRLRSPRRSLLCLLLIGTGLTGACYLALLSGWVIPLVPAVLAMVGAAGAIISYIAHLEEELKRSKEFLQSVINAIPDPVFVKDQNHCWIVLNEAFARFVGYPVDELLEKSDPAFFPQTEADVFWQHDDLLFRQGQAREHEEEFTDRNGFTHLIATKRSLHQDAAGNRFLVGVIRDITERKRTEEELKRTAAELVRSNAELKMSRDHLSFLANHDTLTGLPNRKLFYERLSQSIEWAAINNQMVALLFLDLDGFKEINDTKGHDMGDLVLKAVAERLMGCLRGSDTVARLGGDEFTVILPAIPSEQDAARVADKVLTTLSKTFLIESEQLNVTTSVGISLYPLHAEDMEELIRQADQAMYRAKERGKNCYEFAILP